MTSAYDSVNRLQSAGEFNYCFDANGHQLRRTSSACPSGGDTFGYDYENRLTQANIGSSGTTYTYDGDGVRRKKAVSGGATTSYFQDVSGRLPQVAADYVLMIIRADLRPPRPAGKQ